MNNNEEKDLDKIEEDEQQETVKKSSFLTTLSIFFLELVKIAILAGITIALVRYFLFKPFYVKGQSMEPNYHESDYLIIDEITYRFNEPQRGEVIVFKAPVGNDYYLKRIIGLPGERIKIEDNKVIVYNQEHPQGVVVQENYLNEPTQGSISETLGKDQYFVMGDNRLASYDSRRFGAISKDSIVGRVWFRGWPVDKAGITSKPNYNL